MRLLPLCIALLAATLHAGEVKEGNPTTYRKVLGDLKPGDTLQLEAGVYERGLPISHCHGTSESWITIRGPEIGVAEIRQTQVANCVELSQCSFIALKRLSIIGDSPKSPPGAFGISAKGGLKNLIHDILIEDCIIRDWNSSQQSVGISTKTPTWGWVIRRNSILNCGTGLYLGNSNGDDAFIGGLIENNLVENPIGYCMEIKFQNPRPLLPGMPTTPCRTFIRNNVFIKSDAPSPNGDRPNVLVGGFPSSGPGMEDLYEFHGNLFWHNPRESLLQASGRVIIRDNVFYDCGSKTHDAITLRNHDLPLRLAHVYQNTIFATSHGIRVADPVEEAHSIWGNVIFTADKPLVLHRSIIDVRDQIVGSIAEARNHLKNPDDLDFHPLPGKCEGPPLIHESQHSHGLDFDGRPKGDGRYRGAFAGPALPKAWRLQRALKP